MQATPPNIHSIFANEILSAIPIRPIVVVSNKMIGPIKARELLIMRAFSMSLYLMNKKATNISILPDKTRSSAIPIIAFSSK